VPETARNRLIVHSLNDRIEGFSNGVLATGSRRFFAAPLNAAPKRNHIELKLIGTTIVTPSCAPPGTSENTSALPVYRDGALIDLRLIGAWVENDRLPAGDDNSVRAEIRGVTGSGVQANFFANTAGGPKPLAPHLRGTGNKLEIVGDPQSFARLNRGIDPPPASFFTGR
jgi:hypothetical protein